MTKREGQALLLFAKLAVLCHVTGNVFEIMILRVVMPVNW
jgi:hypothetical protein